MKIEIWCQGATAFSYIQEGIDIYYKRIQHYLPIDFVILNDIKNAKSLDEATIKEKEAELQLKKLLSSDILILLDERGKNYSSVDFSNFLEQMFNLSGSKRIVFLIGGAYGFSPKIYARANHQWSLSKLTFSHQMVRLFVIEQIYRAISIQKGLPYHHE
jgi:23S rRNA (pseudouridine1915-N3)-methyltransferase